MITGVVVLSIIIVGLIFTYGYRMKPNRSHIYMELGGEADPRNRRGSTDINLLLS